MTVPDPGLQPERTALAWRRTTLSLLLCSVAGTRVLAPALGRWALAVGLVGVAATATLVVLTRGRHDRERRDDGRTPPDGLALALTTGLVLCGGVAALGWVLWRAVG